MTTHVFRVAVVTLVIACLGAFSPVRSRAQTPTDLDAFMARVLANRDQSWRQLQEYLLSERERVELIGPDRTRLFGQDREFLWVARDGVAVRSPVRFNGVTLAAADRAQYEQEWLRDEERRAERQRKRSASPGTEAPADREDVEASIRAGEPRFISEASFLRFRFEPGNYYFVGRETIAGVEVLRIEYYPTRMFQDEGKRSRPRDEAEDRIDAAMNKVTLVTLWVDPAQHQVVRFTFDNVDFNFLPGRALVRLDTAQATMNMGQPFEGIWLPTDLTVEGAVTLATGSYRASYRRDFYDYRRGDVQVRFRVKDD
jgi:hypothetical protein